MAEIKVIIDSYGRNYVKVKTRFGVSGLADADYFV